MRRMAVKSILLTYLFILSVGLLACGNDATDPTEPLSARVDFSTGQHGWTADFADYPAGQDDYYELESDYRALVAPLDTSQRALYISGNNHSDDLFMFWKGQIVGLAPNTSYRVRFEVEIATNVPAGCGGVGGSPGESVWVKAGVSQIEPEAVDVGGFLQMNIDKGNQASGGENALVIGDVASSQSCGQGQPQWELKQLSSGSETIAVTVDGEGRVWLLIGTDSGFEATTSLYYTRVLATFEPI
jgi:hypothetical protein